MTYPVWPETLPDWVLEAGYTEDFESNLAEFEPEAGPPIRRRRTSIASRTIGCELVLSDCQYETLISFWRDDCKDGAIRFSRLDPRTQQEKEYTFISPPSMTVESAVWRRVRLSLREMP